MGVTTRNRGAGGLKGNGSSMVAVGSNLPPVLTYKRASAQRDRKSSQRAVSVGGGVRRRRRWTATMVR